MDLIKIDFTKEVSTLDREKFRHHVKQITKDEIEDSITEAMEQLTNMLLTIKYGDIEELKDRMELVDEYKRLRKIIKRMPGSWLRQDHMLQLIDRI